MASDIPSKPAQDPISDPLLRDVPVVDNYKVLDRRYVLFETLGQGGMGVVYRGKHTDLEIEVAVKCLDPGLLRRNDSFVQRFKKEARAAASIQHENVVRVYDVADSSGLHFLVMEFIEGEDVRKRVARKGPLDPDEAGRIILGAARGLAAAHAAGLVHRDIKPDNILNGADGRVKVADLGLAKQIEGDVELTNTGVAMGTPRYMPPEQFSDAKSVGPTADVYSLGATLYLMLTGKDGVQGGSLVEVADRVRSLPFPDPRTEVSNVPAEIADIVLACTRKDPAERPKDGAAVVQMLERESWRVDTQLADPEAGTSGTRSMVSPPPPDRIISKEYSLVVESKVAPSPVDGWADVLVQDPDPEVVTDADGRKRMLATGLPWKVKDRGTGIVMLLVPPGEDVIGASPGDSEAEDEESPAHRVRFTDAFYLGETEVTQAQWETAKVGDDPSYFKGANRPVENVSWDRINEPDSGFRTKTGLRLPSECEWEYACRAGSDAARYGELENIAWFRGNSESESKDVGKRQANAWGFKDMLGNVYEWCSTPYDSRLYSRAKQQGAVDSTFYKSANYKSANGEFLVVRGASWNIFPRNVRASYRNYVRSDFSFNIIGFRVARAP